MLTEFEVCSYSHSGKVDEIPKFKSRSMWLRVCPFLTAFCAAYFPLPTAYLRDKFEPCSFSHSKEIHRVRKSKSRLPQLGHIPFDLVFCMPSKLFLVVDSHTKFEVSSFNRFRDIWVSILKIWASSAILHYGFSPFRSFSGATEYHLVKFKRNLSTCGCVRAMLPFFQLSHFRGPPPNGQIDLRVAGP